MGEQRSRRAVVGVADHGGWAVLVTATRDGALIDRRRVELVDAELPSIPHHHKAQALPIDEAVALVERVRASAERHSAARLGELAADLDVDITGIALRTCPPLPPTVAERIQDYRSQNIADWVMYRQALAGAAEARGWAVTWYDKKTVFAAAEQALGVGDIGAFLKDLRKTIGPPWQQDHRMAMAAAIAAQV